MRIKRKLLGPVKTEKSDDAKSITRSVAASAKLMLTPTSRTAMVASCTPTKRAEAALASSATRVACATDLTTVKV